MKAWLLAACGSVAWMLNSCSPAAGFHPETKASPRHSSGLAETVAPSGAVGADRPGLATGSGDRVDLPDPGPAFDRGKAGPYGRDAIYYNDRTGLRAMGALDKPVPGVRPAAGGVIEWGITGGSADLPAYYKGDPAKDGKRFVEGREGESYSILLRNRSRRSLLAVLSIDGLNVRDGKPAGVSGPGFVVARGATARISGYQAAGREGRAFRFSKVADSKARADTGNTRNVGVIGLAVFTPDGVDPGKD